MSKRGKSLGKEAQQLAYNVIKFVDTEKSGLTVSTHKATERACKMLKMSKPVICKIRKEGHDAETKGKNISPKKKKSGGRNKYVIDGMDKCIIRQQFQKYYEIYKEIPTLKKLYNFCKQELGFQASRETLRKILLSTGFHFKKCKDNRFHLCERENIIAMRTSYLRILRKNEMSEKRPVVYLGETWIHTHYIVKKCWHSGDSVASVYTNSNAGKRLIVAHAGTETGFVPGALFIHHGEERNGDYRSEMNSAIFSKYIEQLIPQLPERSIVVLGNAPYHNKQLNKPPSSNALKADIKSWLKNKGVPFEPDLLKCELLALVKQHAPKPVYEIDKLLEDKGFLPLKLPPYHPDLNPMEFIWNVVKNKIQDRDMSCVTLTDLKDIAKDALSLVNADDWVKAVEQTRRVSDNYWKLDVLIEEEMEDIIIRSGFHSDSDTFDSEIVFQSDSTDSEDMSDW